MVSTKWWNGVTCKPHSVPITIRPGMTLRVLSQVAIISLVPRVAPGILAPYLGLGGPRQHPCMGLLRVEFDPFHPLAN